MGLSRDRRGLTDVLSAFMQAIAYFAVNAERTTRNSEIYRALAVGPAPYIG